MMGATDSRHTPPVSDHDPLSDDGLLGLALDLTELDAWRAWREYADTLLLARALRRWGDIPGALVLEARCVEIYATLPRGLRW